MVEREVAEDTASPASRAVDTAAAAHILVVAAVAAPRIQTAAPAEVTGVDSFRTAEPHRSFAAAAACTAAVQDCMAADIRPAAEQEDTPAAAVVPVAVVLVAAVPDARVVVAAAVVAAVDTAVAGAARRETVLHSLAPPLPAAADRAAGRSLRPTIYSS